MVKADAALAASLFHYKELEISDLKKYLNKMGFLLDYNYTQLAIIKKK